MIRIAFSASDALWDSYQTLIPDACDAQGLTVDLQRDHLAETVDYLVYAPQSDLQDFTPFTRCKAVFSLWAGVEHIVSNATLTQPLCRMVDPGLTDGMVEWVTAHVLRYHLDLDTTLNTQDHWRPNVPPLAVERPVTILGLGALGQACAHSLTRLGFPVTGWSRSPKTLDGITCLHGDGGLQQALSTAEILVLLLPDTTETQDIINAQTLAQLPQGTRLLNPGRGTLIDDQALVSALDTGHIAHATLDVFRTEPLPHRHPYWAHPNVTVTPHIAAETRPVTAAQVIAENIARGEARKPFKHQVNRTRGY